jgi:hypothetical protein
MTLNYENSKVVNFTVVRNMILEDAPPVHIYNPRKIKRNHCRVVVSEPETNEYNVDFKKRRLMEKFDTHTDMSKSFIYLFIEVKRK